MSHTRIKDNEEVNGELRKLFGEFQVEIDKLTSQWQTISFYESRDKLQELLYQVDQMINVNDKDLSERYNKFIMCDHKFKEGEDSLVCDKCNLIILGLRR
jgi:hypothetical protein